MLFIEHLIFMNWSLPHQETFRHPGYINAVRIDVFFKNLFLLKMSLALKEEFVFFVAQIKLICIVFSTAQLRTLEHIKSQEENQF